MSLKELDEAIETITKIRLGETVTGGEYMRALKLGIEALEMIQRAREYKLDIVSKPLPSEGEK